MHPSLKMCVVLFACALPSFASSTDNIVVRQNISESDRKELTKRLRTITGWSELSFNGDGALKTGDTTLGGSQVARNLMNKTLSGTRVILFEDASSRKDVVFCRVVLGKLDRTPAAEVFVVLIDFADFRRVTGDKQALAAFDVGWAVLHEIDHVVEDSVDPKEDDAPGNCEAHINRMRRELGVPVRNSYFFSFLPVKNDGNLISRFVRMGFDHDNGLATKKKRYWLVWDAALVGGVGSDSESTRASLDIF